MSTKHPFHPGEVEAQQRFNADWDDQKSAGYARIIGSQLDDRMRQFIESRQFFFLATADSAGNCDCSFKGSQPAEGGALTKAVSVLNPQLLLFPDYAGNKLFNSLGNLLQNPHAGLIFMSFSQQLRLRVNGCAKILEYPREKHKLWSDAPRAIQIDIEQCYWNCNKRIPVAPE
jgi:uncharacterized protein